MDNNIKILVHSKDEVLKELILEGGQTAVLRAQENVTYEVKDLATGNAPEEVVLKRKGDHLELYTEAGSATPLAVIEDYYLLPEPSPLVGLAENGVFYPYVPQSGNAEQLPWNLEDGDSSYQSLGYDTQGSFIPWWPIIIAGALLAGGIAAASSSSSSSSGPGTPEPTDPNAPKSVIIGNDGNEFITADEIDNEGKVTVTVELPDTGVEVGDTVVVNDEDYVITQDDIDNNKIEIKLPAPEEGEELTVDASIKDKDGNTSDTVSASATVDTEPPEDPFIKDIDDEGNVKGETEPGATITDKDGNPLEDENGEDLKADENGDFTIPKDSVPDDDTIKAKDDAGNESGEVNILKLPPIKNALDAVDGNGEPIDDAENYEQVADGDHTNDNRPLFEIPAEMAADVNKDVLIINGEVIAASLVEISGKTYLQPDSPLTEDTHEVSYTTNSDALPGTDLDKLGANETSHNFGLTIDITPPDAPTLELAEDTGSDDSDGITSNGTVTVDNLEDGATWEYSTDGGTTWDDGTGTSFELPEGEYADGKVLARQTDKAGNISGNGELGPVTVDTTSPGGDDDNDAPVLAIAEADDNFINADEISDGIQAVVTLTDGTQAGDTVTVTLTDSAGDTHEFTHIVTADDIAATEVEMTLNGTFAEGAASTVAVITDDAGNSSANSNEVTFTIDTKAPGAPHVEFDGNKEFINAKDYEEAKEDGLVIKVSLPKNDPDNPHQDVEAGDILVVKGTIVNQERGSAESRFEYELTEDDIAALSSGSAVIEIPLALPEFSDGKTLDGETINVDAYIKDAAGNTSEEASTSADVDITPPPAPIITELELGADGNLDGGVKGNTEAGATITDKDGNPLKDENGEDLKADENGDFTIPKDSVPDDDTIKAKDEAGNESIPVNILKLPPIENALDAVDGNGATIVGAENYEQVAYGEHTNDSQPLFEIPIQTDDDGNPVLDVNGIPIINGNVVNTTILIINGAVVDASLVTIDGKTYLQPNNPLTDALHTVGYTTGTDSNDLKPNETSSDFELTIDTIAPAKPDEVVIGNDGNEFITADEIDENGKVTVIVKLPDTGVEAGDIIITNGEERVITQEDIDKKEVEIKLDAPEEGEELEVDVSIKDKAGNLSETESAAATKDTTPPDVIAQQIPAIDNQILVQSNEEGTIVIKGGDGTIIGTGEITQTDVYQNIVLDRAVANGEKITVTVTDAAGNVGSADFSAKLNNTLAVDNVEELVLEATPTEVNMEGRDGSYVGEKATNFGVVSAGLGGVADASVLDFDALINVTVDEGTSRKFDLFADGGGVSIAEMYDLVILKEDEYGNWKFHQVYEDWFSVPLLGNQKRASITIDEPGNYIISLNKTAGVGVLSGSGLEIEGDTLFDYNNPTSVSGEKRGNMLTDINNFGDNLGQDEFDEHNTTVTKITFDGQEYLVPSNGILTVEGEHGTLTVEPTGEYTYALKEGALPAYGTKESFGYTITNAETGDSSTANLEINLVQTPSNVLPATNETLWLAPEAQEITIPPADELSSKSWSEVAGLGLGIADVDAVIIENGMDIHVGENQVRDISFSGAGGAPVAIGYTPVTFALYKLEKTEHGDFWQLHTVEEDWWGVVGVVVGAGQSSEDLQVRLDEGEYKAVLIPNTAGIAVIPTVTLNVKSDTLYEHSSTNSELSSAVEMGGDDLYSVNGVKKGNADNVTVQGEYGTLVFNNDGSYTYTLKPSFANKNIGAMDTFSYTMRDPLTGQLKTSTLNVTINSVQASDDVGRVGFGMDNIEDYEGWSVDTTSRGSSNKTYSQEVVVGENQVFDLTLDYNFNPFPRADKFTIELIKDGVVIDTYEPNSRGEAGKREWLLEEAGTYEVKVMVDPRLANSVNVELDLNGTVTTLDKFTTEEGNHSPDEGNLLDNDGYTDYGHLEVNGKQLSIITDEKFNNNATPSIEIEGEYGTLTVHQDGSYIYHASGDAYGVEEFEYKLISINGTSESAKLTINVGMDITGSKHDDIITGSDGGDKLVYNVLDGEDGRGGNGTDTWTDFKVGNTLLDAAADQIDLSKLLGDDVNEDNIDEYLKLEHNADDNTLTLSIDRDGAGDKFGSEALLVLENQTDAVDLAELLQNDQILI